MFTQIIEAIAKIIELLNNRKVLSDAKKRREIGASLVDLHQALSRICENAHSIEHCLHALINDRYDMPDWYLRDLRRLLNVQRHELLQMQRKLRDSRGVIEIYADDLHQAMNQLVGVKVSLVDVIASLALAQPAEAVVSLPSEVGSYGDSSL